MASYLARRLFSNTIKSKLNILERLSKGVVVGDGGYVFALEKRG